MAPLPSDLAVKVKLVLDEGFRQVGRQRLHHAPAQVRQQRGLVGGWVGTLGVNGIGLGLGLELHSNVRARVAFSARRGSANVGQALWPGL